MSYKFGPGEYRTRDGRKAIVEFVMREPHSGQPLVGQAQFHDGSWNHCRWGLDGMFFSDGEDASWDLVPPVREVWGVFCERGVWYCGTGSEECAKVKAKEVRGTYCLMREVSATVSDKEEL